MRRIKPTRLVSASRCPRRRTAIYVLESGERSEGSDGVSAGYRATREISRLWAPVSTPGPDYWTRKHREWNAPLTGRGTSGVSMRGLRDVAGGLVAGSGPTKQTGAPCGQHLPRELCSAGASRLHSASPVRRPPVGGLFGASADTIWLRLTRPVSVR
jgi:hypothetical protein